jgi:antitoxin (DNA-binding transcriptional repressor) of toxin-antitoxin stability system
LVEARTRIRFAGQKACGNTKFRPPIVPVESRSSGRRDTRKARQDFRETLKLARKGERVVLHRREKDVAAIVSMEDLALLEALEDWMDLEAVRAARQEPRTIPWDQVKAELGLP